jgi:hypothetical protein
MVSQLEGRGIGVQVGLPGQVGLLIVAHIMVEEGDRYDEGCEALMIGGDDLAVTSRGASTSPSSRIASIETPSPHSTSGHTGTKPIYAPRVSRVK